MRRTAERTDGPFLTLAAAKTAMAGGAVKVTYVRAGTYSIASGWNFTGADNGTSWIAYPNEVPILEASGTGQVTRSGVTFLNAITFAGFQIQNLAADGWDLSFSTNMVLRWNTWLNLSQNGIFGVSVTNALIDSNTFSGQTPGNVSGVDSGYQCISLQYDCSGNQVTHNLFQNVAGGCVGISTASVACNNNLIDRNIARNCCNNCYDFGAFYIYDVTHSSVGNQITNNIIDGSGTPGASLPTVGIYLDDETSNVIVSGNLFRNSVSLGWLVHGGDHNLFANNVWDLSNGPSQWGLYQSSAGTHYGMASNVFAYNLVYFSGSAPSPLDQVSLFGPDVTGVAGNNLYYSATGATIPNTTIVDSSRILANPGFTSPSTGDYSMPATSPAFAMGFTALPTDQGPLPSNFASPIAILTVITTAPVPTGTYPITVTGTSGATSHTAPVLHTVSPGSGFILSTIVSASITATVALSNPSGSGIPSPQLKAIFGTVDIRQIDFSGSSVGINGGGTGTFTVDITADISSISSLKLAAFIDGTLTGMPISAPAVLTISGLFLTLTYADGTVVNVIPTGVGFVSQSGFIGPDNAGGNLIFETLTGGSLQRDYFNGFIDCNYIQWTGFSVPTTLTPAWLLINEPVIGITDRSNYLHMAGQHSFSLQLRQRGQASVDLFIAAGDTYAPTRGTPFYLFDQVEDGEQWFLVFSGLIQDLEDKWLANDGSRIVTLTGVSLESVFDTVYAPPTQYVNQTAGAIVSDLIARFEVGCPVAFGVISPGAVIPLLVTNYEKLSDLFDQLATTSEYTWGVNPYGEFFFQSPSSISAPRTFDQTELLWETASWKQTGADYRNRQAVRLSYDAFAHSCEFFVGAGQKTITLSRPVEQVTNAWATLSTCNTATGTFSGTPAPGDTVTIGIPTGVWVPLHIYALGGTLIDINGYVQKVTTAGTSGSSLPTFSDITTGTTIDATVIWTCEGPSGLATGTETYTFVATLDNTQFGQVLIAGSPIQNLVDAIDANAITRGLTFSLPTWEGSLCNAINVSGSSFTIQQKHAGTGWIAQLSATGTAFSWSSSQTSGGTSPQGSLGPNEGATISLQVYVEGTSVAAPGVAYTPGSNVVSLATPLNVGSNLNIEYTRADGNIIEVENSAEVARFALLTHGTGKVQQITDASSQGMISNSSAGGLQLAQQALAAYIVAPQEFIGETYVPGLFPGQTLPVSLLYPTHASTLLNANWIIEEITAELVPVERWIGGNRGHYRFTIHAVNIQEIGSYLDFWEGKGGGGGSGGGSGGALVATTGGGLAATGPNVAQTFTAVSHEFIKSYDAATGLFTAAQPVEADVTSLVSDLALKAPLASPALTGTPTVPTASPGTNTTQLASTAFVTAAVAAGGGGGGGGGGTGALVLLEEHTASSSAELDFTARNVTGQSGATFQSDYDEYEIHWIGVIPATNATSINIQFSVNGGSTYDTTSIYDSGGIYVYGTGGTGGYGTVNGGGISPYGTNVSNSSSFGTNLKATLFSPLSTVLNKMMFFQGVKLDSSIPLGRRDDRWSTATA